MNLGASFKASTTSKVRTPASSSIAISSPHTSVQLTDALCADIVRTCLTVGGDHITYDGNKSTPTANLVTVKLLINSTISTPNAKFYNMDLSNFYLMTPMSNYKYMRLSLDLIPDEIVQRYNLLARVNNQGWVYVEIQVGMHGLPQADILANKLLESRLNTCGYYHCLHTPGLWRHVWLIWRPPQGVKRKWRDDESRAKIQSRREIRQLSTLNGIPLAAISATQCLVANRPSSQANSFHRNLKSPNPP